MKRTQRRAAEAKVRKETAKSFMQRETGRYHDHIKHLPQVPIDELMNFEPGRIYHTCYHHDTWCKIYQTGSAADCNCEVEMTVHVEPTRV